MKICLLNIIIIQYSSLSLLRIKEFFKIEVNNSIKKDFIMMLIDRSRIVRQEFVLHFFYSNEHDNMLNIFLFQNFFVRTSKTTDSTLRRYQNIEYRSWYVINSF